MQCVLASQELIGRNFPEGLSLAALMQDTAHVKTTLRAEKSIIPAAYPSQGELDQWHSRFYIPAPFRECNLLW